MASGARLTCSYGDVRLTSVVRLSRIRLCLHLEVNRTLTGSLLSEMFSGNETVGVFDMPRIVAKEVQCRSWTRRLCGVRLGFRRLTGIGGSVRMGETRTLHALRTRLRLRSKCCSWRTVFGTCGVTDAKQLSRHPSNGLTCEGVQLELKIRLFKCCNEKVSTF